MQKWQKKTVIATAVALFLGIFILRSGVNLLYMNHIPADSKPMPAVMHIAMGTNDDKQNAGWFNGYNWNTYEKHDFMPEPAAKEAKEHLLEFAEECVNDPAMATLPVGLQMFSGELGTAWGPLMAAATMAVVPSIAVVLVLQKQLSQAGIMGGFGGR